MARRPARPARELPLSRLRPAPVAAAALLLLAVAAVAEVAGLRQGVPAEGRDWLLAALCAPLGARIAAHDRRNACGWLLLGAGLLAAVEVVTALPATGPAVWVHGFLWWPGFGLLVLITALFPDGRPASPRWRPVVAVLAGAVAAGTVALASLVARAPGLFDGETVGSGADRLVFLIASVIVLAGGVLAAVSVVLRIRRAAVRGPLVWAAVTAGLLAVALVLDAVGGVPVVWLAAVLAVPVATAVGVLRYGLYDVGLLMHRGLLYGVLTVAAILLYTGAVTATAWLAPGAATPVAAAVTTVALLPLRHRTQAGLQRLLYGRHPYEVVTTVGRSPSLDGVVGELAGGLRVPYVEIRAGSTRAVHGRRRSWPVTAIPLAHDGELLVQQRGPDEPWTRRDRDLLADLAHQLGPVVLSVLLRRDLQSAHALAERTRQLQRDLHDGLGPALFGARLLVRAGRAGAPAWDELDAELAGATTEVRRILSGLGPAALDRGLPAALEALAHRHRTGRLDVVLELGADLGGLPAAVETAAYRIVDECLTNVGRHAHARTAAVTVHRDGDLLRIAVLDDGTGGAAERPGGIGLSSLRDRCRQLNGTFTVADRRPGTAVHAHLGLG